jgi:hypothetical protein
VLQSTGSSSSATNGVPVALDSTLPTARASRLSLRQVVAQNDGTVVKNVVGTVKESHRAAFLGIEDGFPGIRVGGQLLPVTPAKLLPALDLMAKPLPQLRAGGHVLHPRICSDGLLLHPSWPEALHQDPPAVSPRGRVIRALDLKHGNLSSFILDAKGYACY